MAKGRFPTLSRAISACYGLAFLRESALRSNFETEVREGGKRDSFVGLKEACAVELKGKERCKTCGRAPDETRLSVCPICNARTCRDHAYRRSGKPFCSKECAEWFFYGETGDSDAEDK